MKNQAFLENVAMLIFPLFTKFCGSPYNHENCGKSWSGRHFPHFGVGKRGQANFFQSSIMSEEILTIMKIVEKVGLADIFHISGLENVARPTFSSFPQCLRKSLQS